MSETRRWQRGDTVVLRYPPEDRMVRCYQEINRDPVVHAFGWPHVVLEDSAERVAVYMPEGTPLTRWNLGADRPRPPRISQGESVRLLFPGRRYEVTAFFETGSGPAPWVRQLFPSVSTDRFYGWKVDLTSPFVRTEVGFDMIDETLDILIGADMSVRWKDEDQMERFLELGLYTPEEAEELREVGRGVIDLAERGLPPFDDEWLNWRPTPELSLGEVPAHWPYVSIPAPYRAFMGPLE